MIAIIESQFAFWFWTASGMTLAAVTTLFLYRAWSHADALAVAIAGMTASTMVISFCIAIIQSPGDGVVDDFLILFILRTAQASYVACSVVTLGVYWVASTERLRLIGGLRDDETT